MRRLLLGGAGHRQAGGRTLRFGALVASGVTLGIVGCGPQTFSAKGTIASEGDRINTWRTRVEGCTRAPFDALPAGQTRSTLTFVWQDPASRDQTLDMFHNPPDFPMRLEFSRGEQGPVATLHTLRHAGIRLDSKVCGTFRLETAEHPPDTPEGRPSLSGEVVLECGIEQAHITANVRFEGCKY